MITATIPILPSSDLIKTRAFYNQLGFMGEPTYEDYLILRREGQELHFFKHEKGQHEDHSHFSCYLRATDIDSLYDEFRAAGVKLDAPGKRSWGMKEMTLTDPDGTFLRFGEYLR